MAQSAVRGSEKLHHDVELFWEETTVELPLRWETCKIRLKMTIWAKKWIEADILLQPPQLLATGIHLWTGVRTHKCWSWTWPSASQCPIKSSLDMQMRKKNSSGGCMWRPATLRNDSKIEKKRNKTTRNLWTWLWFKLLFIWSLCSHILSESKMAERFNKKVTIGTIETMIMVDSGSVCTIINENLIYRVVAKDGSSIWIRSANAWELWMYSIKPKAKKGKIQS